jgi:hypothetical protein
MVPHSAAWVPTGLRGRQVRLIEIKIARWSFAVVICQPAAAAAQVGCFSFGPQDE